MRFLWLLLSWQLYESQSKVIQTNETNDKDNQLLDSGRIGYHYVRPDVSFSEEPVQKYSGAPHYENAQADIIVPSGLEGQQQEHPQDQYHRSVQQLLAANPLFAALFLSSTLGIPPETAIGFNHPQHPPINPYVALLLSHYGRYLNVPGYRTSRGLYGYVAANNYHNNKPFGAYKIYEDA